MSIYVVCVSVSMICALCLNLSKITIPVHIVFFFFFHPVLRGSLYGRNSFLYLSKFIKVPKILTCFVLALSKLPD